MTYEELRDEVVAVTRRATEGLDDDLARRIAAARATCAADSDDELAPARGIVNAIGISAALLLAAFVLASAFGSAA